MGRLILSNLCYKHCKFECLGLIQMLYIQKGVWTLVMLRQLDKDMRTIDDFGNDFTDYPISMKKHVSISLTWYCIIKKNLAPPKILNP